MGVYKKNNRWLIDYYLPNGKRKRESVKIQGVDPSKITRTDALKALTIRKAQIAEGTFNISSALKPLSFIHLMKQFLEWAEDNHKYPSRTVVASKPLLSFFENKQVSQINLWQVEKYKSGRRSVGRKPETINKELGVLRRMFNLAEEWKLISSNPIKGMKLVKVPQYLASVVKQSEFQALYHSASEHFKPILLCAYLTGMRKGEIRALKWEDVDLTEGYIVVKEAKSNESRAIPISETLKNVLKSLKRESKSEFVFTTNEGIPYTSNSSWEKAWSTALRNAGIGHCRFHDLRHTFVSNLIVEEKEDYATVMALSGHKDITMLKRYSHTKEEAKKNAIKKLENRFKLAGMDTYMDTKAQTREIK